MRVGVQSRDLVDPLQPALGTVDHRDRDGAVELDDRGRLNERQPVVYVADAPPVGVLGAPRACVFGGDGRLERVGARRQRSRRALSEYETLGDLVTVP